MKPAQQVLTPADVTTRYLVCLSVCLSVPTAVSLSETQEGQRTVWNIEFAKERFKGDQEAPLRCMFQWPQTRCNNYQLCKSYTVFQTKVTPCVNKLLESELILIFYGTQI